MNSLDDLIEMYRDGSLTDAGRSELEQALANDPAARERFVAQMDLSARLQQRGIQREEGNDALVSFPTVARSENQSSRRAWLPAGIAAIGLAAAFVIAMFYRGSKDSQQEPSFVAVVTSAEDAMWENGSVPEVGGSLLPGSWKLARGRIEATLENGAELFLDAPLHLEVESAFRTTLHGGNLSARVPPSALGFRVLTPEIEVIDLGTEFSVSVGESGESAVRVLDGFVDARPLAGGKTQRLARSEEARFGDPAATSSDPVFNAPRPLDAAFPTVTGDIRILHSRPSSFKRRAFEHDYLLLFRERSSFQLPRAVSVDLSEPGASPHSARAVQKMGLTLSPGTLVDSWMIHFDGVDRDQLVCEAELSFPSDILAVIATPKSLDASDDLLGFDEADYPSHKLRGVEFYTDDPYQIDEIVLSGDRRLLKLRWHVSTQIDQIRILTAPKS